MPLKQPAGWGSIDDVLKQPPENVAADASWCSVIGMWLTLPLNIIQGLFAALCACIYRNQTFAGCCCTIYSSVVAGRPFTQAFLWWRYAFGGVFALLLNGKSRLAMFLWEKEACGGGEYFWQGEGIWATSYAKVTEIMQSQQGRTQAFACIRACTPDLFASGLLIFLPTGGPESEWARMRFAIHQAFLNSEGSSYQERLRQLPIKVKESWPDPKLADLNDKALLQKMVCRGIFYMMFGVWVEEEDAKTLSGWRTYAPFFVLPRYFHRFLFNQGIKKVAELRRKTVQIVEKNNLQEVFVNINSGLPAPYRRDPIVKLCDEIMYGVGFAGIGGTSACVESTAQFLQLKTGEVPKDKVSFASYQSTDAMLAAYRSNPVNYIKEVCRLDPPVTSATSVVLEDEEVEMGTTGVKLAIAKGFLRQYTLSLANRDPAIFDNPELFNPQRANLERAVTWNGELNKGEEVYPRLCPGRYLSLQVAQAVIDHGITALRSGP